MDGMPLKLVLTLSGNGEILSLSPVKGVTSSKTSYAIKVLELKVRKTRKTNS
jgi:hypothetical protein